MEAKKRPGAAWNVMTLDGYFEGVNPWQLDMHGTVWGDELEAFAR